MEEILSYLERTYAPECILLYGSYADHTETEQSDFDALLVCPDGKQTHDTSVIGSTRLDVFVYPRSALETDFDPDAFLQLYDSVPLRDTDGFGEQLRNAVRAYAGALPRKTEEELDESLAWCSKMLLRAGTPDAFGAFRLHWLLTDSPEIYCELKHLPYFGPKKCLLRMQREDPDSFAVYEQALLRSDASALESWIRRLYAIAGREFPNR